MAALDEETRAVRPRPPPSNPRATTVLALTAAAFCLPSNGPRRALQELMAIQTRLVEQSNQLQTARTAQQLKLQEHKRNDMTLRELEKLDDNVTTYRAVGRMFLGTTLAEAREDLAARRDKAKADAEAAGRNIEALERSLAQGEESLRELVQKKGLGPA